MAQEVCEICGYASNLGAVEKHFAIPKEVTQPAGLPDEQIGMCCNCRRELDKWYSIKVAKMVFDWRAQCFRDRTETEMAEEYSENLEAFMKYKRKQGQTS